MLSILRHRLATGIVSSRYPALPEVPPPAFRGMPELVEAACRGDGACAAVCPTAAIQVTSMSDGWTWHLDRAACIGCGLCMEVCPYTALTVSPEFELASGTRADLVETVRFVRPSNAHRAEVAR